MVLDAITWACALLAAGADTSDVWHMNTGKFQIPIRIQPNRRNEIKELQLFVSRDQGKSWELYAKSTPDKDNFTYLTSDDGLYWFSVAVVDQKGQLDPRDPMKAPVGQKIMVDTKKPEVRINAERHGEEVVVRWEARDEYPDFQTMKVEYRTADAAGGLWTAVPSTPGATGTATIRPGTTGPLMVQVQLKDMAGNLGQAQAEIPGSGTTLAMPSLPVIPGAGLTSMPPGNFAPANGNTASPVVSNWNTALGNPPVSGQPGRVPDPLDTPPGPQVSALPVGNSGTTRGSVVALSGSAAANPLAGDISTGSGPRPGTNSSGSPVDLKIVNKRQVKLDFEVGKVGPSGLGNVDVYVTTDEGQTWAPQPCDGNAVFPPSLERTGGPVRGSVAVQLAREGVIYGFTLVVKSRAGLGKAAPQRGDPPQLRVELDTTLPEAELYEPKPDANRPDALVLSWKASDRNLAENPITLEWAERPEGPWLPIGATQLPNSGRHSWMVPSNVPPKVHLRLTVRDTAGNTAVAQTDKPILVDLTIPELRAISLSAISK